MKILKANLDKVKGILRSDQDFPLVIVGYEGSGKSTLGLIICKHVDPDFSVKDICFTGEELMMRMQQKQKYGAILADEAVGPLFTRRAMSSTNIDIVQTLATCRYKNLFFVFCIPELFMLDAYMRTHRPRALVRILKRGAFAFYSRKRVTKIKREEGTKVIKWPEPNFIERFPILNDNLWQDYLKKKEAYISTDRSEKVWREKLKIEAKMKKSFTLRDIATMHGFKKKTVEKWIYEYTLFPKRETFKDLFGQNRVTEKGYKIFLKRLKEARKTFGGLKKYKKVGYRGKKRNWGTSVSITGGKNVRRQKKPKKGS